ncbi:MAG: FIVAR domain-containing protein [Dysgonamonadaceae bacterium]|jgi:hypothetical protein|nr:FIVAR domain-containing protein [Dysgonamonadaceae bacterium]
MKKQLFLAYAMLSALLSSTTLQAQTDVTAQYLTNADFETAPIAYEGPGNTLNPAATLLSSSGLGSRVVVPAGWTAECGTPGSGGNAQYARLATGLFGVNYTSIPDAFNGVKFPTSDRTGAFLALSGGYGTTPRLVQSVTLPAGVYQLQYDVYDQNPNYAFTNLFGFVPNSGTAVYDNITQFTASAWETRTVSFTLDALTAGKISIGITGNSSGSGANAHLAIDNIKLFFTGDASSAITPLKAELTALRDSTDMPAGYDVTEVNALLAMAPTSENTTQLISDLTAAISTLQNIITSSNSLKVSIAATQALADIIAIDDVKTKLNTEIAAANTVIATNTTSMGLATAKAFLDALRAFAANIQTAKALYDTTVEGTTAGQYPTTARVDFLAAITTAITACALATDATDVNTANNALNNASTTYQNAVVIPTFVPLVNKAYVIRHATDFVLTQTATVAKIQAFADTPIQKFRFVQVVGASGTYNIVSMEDSKLLAREGSWATQWLENNAANAALANAQFQFVFRTGDYFAIKNLGSNSYLGTDAVTDGSEIYSNKGGTDAAKHYWTFEEQPGDLGFATTALENAIIATQALADTIAITEVAAKLNGEIATATALLTSATAQSQIDDAALYLTALRTLAENIQANKELYDSTIGGTAGGQYPVAARADFLSAINTAITAFSAAITAADANTANTALNAANYNYLSAYINPFAGFTFNLKHYNSNFYVSRAKNNSFTNAHIQALDTVTYEQEFVFEKILGVVNGVRMKTLSGYYLNHSGYTSSWTTSPAAGSDMIVEKDASGYINLKFVSDNEYFGTDGNTDGSSIYTNKNGTSNNHHWMIEVTDPRAKLDILINEVTAKLAAAVPGTQVGQYPQSAIDNLATALTSATAVYNNENATGEELSAAYNNLNATMAWFISQQIVFSTQYLGRPLWIIHSSGNLLSKVDYDTYAHINKLNTPNASQTFEFVAVEGQVDVVALKSNDGRYLSYSGWNTPWIGSMNANTYLKLTPTSDGYLNIKFVGNNYLGTNDANDSTTVYADKGATSLLSKWGIQEMGSIIKIELGAVIVKSDTLLNHISAGTANFQFPAVDYNTFVNVLDASKAVLADENATQAEVDAQVATLNDALTALYAKQILPVLTPETSARYLVTNKSYSGYLTDNGIRAIVGTNVPLAGWEILKLTDSTYVFKNCDLAMAQSVNMVTYAANAADQVWKLHYDGAKAYEVYTPDTVYHFAFIGGTNALQFTSGGQVQLVAEHSHTAQAQWFAVNKIGAPITSTLSTLIANVQSTLSSATIGTAYGQYPQTAKESLTTALTDAQTALDNSETMTQAEINAAVNDLQNALTWFNNQKVVWRPQTGMAYFIGNRDNANYLSIDTLNAGVAKGYKLDSIPFVNQLWFFMPVENKAGFYHIINGKYSVGNSGGTSIFVEEYDAATAKQIEVKYQAAANGIEYFLLTTTNTYPNIQIGSEGNVSSDRYTYNNYQLKLVAAGALRTEVLYAVQLRDSASVGNGIGQYPQASYDAFVEVINTSIETATGESRENDEAQLQALKDAENTFRASQNGYGLDLAALLAAVEVANDLLETTTVVGSSAGQCPQTTVDALTAAIVQSQDATGGITQAIIDQKVTDLNQAIDGFKTALKASTGLTNLLTACLEQYNEAVEGTNPGQYAAGSKAIFMAAIDAAQAVLDAEPVIQSALIAAYNSLNAARDVFNAAIVANLWIEDLQAVIAEVEAFLANKPAGEYANLRAKLAEAQALLANPATTQEQIDAMTDELYEALEAAETGIGQLLAMGVQVFAANGALHISGLTGHAQLGIYNTLGQRILSAKVTGSEFIRPLEKGLYIVTVNSAHVKIIIR